MTKTYSTRSNARRAAEKAGLTGYRLEPRDSGFAVVADAPRAEQPAADQPAEAGDFTPPAFLARDAVANPTEPRAEEQAWEVWKDERRKAAVDLAAEQPIEGDAIAVIAQLWDALHTKLGFEGDAVAARGLFMQAYLAGQQAATRKPRGPRGERTSRREGPTKREIAARLLTRPEGTTTREILDATGWPAVSVPAIAKASSLKLRQEKKGRVTRYFAEAT